MEPLCRTDRTRRMDLRDATVSIARFVARVAACAGAALTVSLALAGAVAVLWKAGMPMPVGPNGWGLPHTGLLVFDSLPLAGSVPLGLAAGSVLLGYAFRPEWRSASVIGGLLASILAGHVIGFELLPAVAEAFVADGVPCGRWNGDAVVERATRQLALPLVPIAVALVQLLQIAGARPSQSRSRLRWWIVLLLFASCQGLGLNGIVDNAIVEPLHYHC